MTFGIAQTASNAGKPVRRRANGKPYIICILRLVEMTTMNSLGFVGNG